MAARILLIILCISPQLPLAAPPPPPGPYEAPLLEGEVPIPPWKRRRRIGVKGLKGRGKGLIKLNSWPPEPLSPKKLKPQRFGAALRSLCGPELSKRRGQRYSAWILEYAQRFKVDPFLLAALIYRQSRCDARKESGFGLGLTGINLRMYRADFKGRSYHYHIFKEGVWEPQELKLPDFRFSKAQLKKARPSLYFGAALLSMWKAQWPALRTAFASVPHRHFVSHFLWGDRVDGAGGEDRVLRARRRLLEYYLKTPSKARAEFEQGRALHCPLDGAPRKISSRMGEDRDGGGRRHQGLDFDSTGGEPVRAVADGRIVVAGVDLKGPGHRNMPFSEARRFPYRKMAPGGLFVMISHGGGWRSAYMHLSRYTVERGQRVKAGDLIGYVGRSGIRASGAHLHFEIRKDGVHLDPLPLIKPYIFEPEESYRGRRVALVQWQNRRDRRRSRYRAWRAKQQRKREQR